MFLVIVFATFLPGVHAESTRKLFERLIPKIAYLNYGDVLWLRNPEGKFPDDPDMKTSWENYKQAMEVNADLAELAELCRHEDPKVRTLAMLRLYHMEDPLAFRVIHTLAKDKADGIPSREFNTALPDGTLEYISEPRTVRQAARSMLDQAKFPVEWLEDPTSDFAAEEWSGWYKYHYHRATGRSSPIRKERAPQTGCRRAEVNGTGGCRGRCGSRDGLPVAS